MFDDMVVAQIRRLNGAWPELVAPVQFAVEDAAVRSRPLGGRASLRIAVFPR